MNTAEPKITHIQISDRLNDTFTIITYEKIKEKVYEFLTIIVSFNDSKNYWSILLWKDNDMTILEHANFNCIPIGSKRLITLNSNNFESDFDSEFIEEISIKIYNKLQLIEN